MGFYTLQGRTCLDGDGGTRLLHSQARFSQGQSNAGGVASGQSGEGCGSPGGHGGGRLAVTQIKRRIGAIWNVACNPATWDLLERATLSTNPGPLFRQLNPLVGDGGEKEEVWTRTKS